MRLWRYLKDGFVAGLILIAPLAITLYVLSILVNWSLRFVDPVVAETRLVQYTANVELAAQVIAVVLIVAAITLLGVLAEWSVGKHVFGNVGRTVYVVPLVSTIYGSIRQVATSLVERDSKFERVVLVEYPREDLYSIGLVTGDGKASIDAVAGERAYPVFLPNSPNPTAGRLVMVPDSQVLETDMSVREGMRMIVTTGIGPEDPELDAYELVDEDGDLASDGVSEGAEALDAGDSGDVAGSPGHTADEGENVADPSGGEADEEGDATGETGREDASDASTRTGE